jgi:hypothetical protein
LKTRVSTVALLGVAVVAAATAVLSLNAVAAQAATPMAAPPPALTVAQDGTITGLVPGGAAHDVNYTITNATTAPLHAPSVTISITGVSYVNAAGTRVGATWLNHPAGGSAPGCPVEDFTIVQPDAPGPDLAPGATAFTRRTAVRSGLLAMRNATRNQDDCKGITVALALSGG